MRSRISKPYRPGEHSYKPAIPPTDALQLEASTAVMPHVYIRNETGKVLNLAFSFAAPCAFTNGVEPGATWTAHDMGTMLYPSFEVCIDQGEPSRYSAGESLAAAGTIVGAYALGAASVAVGAGSFLGAFFGGFAGAARAPAGLATAGVLMKSARRGACT